MNDIIEVTDKALVVADFEKSWQKKLVNSNIKAQEWLFRHAREIYEFRKACDNQQLDLPAASKIYFAAKMQEWLGYEDDFARKWSNVGKFIERFEAGLGETLRTSSRQLPTSMSTLLEFSRLNDSQLKMAVEAELLHPQVTREDVQNFRKGLAQLEKKEDEVNDKKHAEHIKKVEAELLYFNYADSVPDWIVEKIEDLVDAIGPEKVGSTLKFNQDGAIWVCTKVEDLWDAVEVAAPEPKVEPKAKPEAKPEPVDEITGRQYDLPINFIDALTILGINLNKRYIESWALAALLKSAKQMYHPDKIKNDEIFKKLPDVEKLLRRKGNV